ncbi:hypothetical protein R3P38DRAFT_2866054 [Favolaschia claudopus]|uniref:F-box domain-containing protein n=1 Tax=Favolaschia claudopus TaxID=2862362 RepID=A0AAW0DH53_9AGAR
MSSRNKLLLTSLPAEIIREIASSVAYAGDLAALCRTSRLLHAVSTPVLFRHLRLARVMQTLHLLNVLKIHPKRHKCVRSLRIDLPDRPSLWDSLFISTDILWPLEDTLRRVENLTTLYIRAPNFSNDKFLAIFTTLILPNLRSFSIHHTGTYSPILSSFLNRHKDLTHLELVRPYKTAATPDVLPLIHLPHLRSYRGCSVYAAHLVVSNQSLAGVQIWDAPPATELDELFAALAAATSPTIPFTLTFLWDGPQTALFAPLGKHLPHTRALDAGPFAGYRRPLTAASIKEISEALDQFVSLTTLEFDNVEDSPRIDNVESLSGGRPDPPSFSVAEDLATLDDWITHCPTLTTCRLHCRIWTRQSGKWNLLFE